jgi:hypothetical protein
VFGAASLLVDSLQEVHDLPAATEASIELRVLRVAESSAHTCGSYQQPWIACAGFFLPLPAASGFTVPNPYHSP